jgi:aspartate racemase
MKTIGLIGGMSWESSIEYYRIVNQRVKEKLGGLHSARCVMYSLDFAEIEVLQHQGRWQGAAKLLVAAAQKVQEGGADFIVLCTNTMHKVADEIQANLAIPFLHIADATAQAIQAAGIKNVGLLGTRFTMEEEFYKGRLQDKHALRVLVPEEREREIIDRVIYEELVLGIIRPESKAQYMQAMERLVDGGAQGIILGCTEIGLLVKQDDSPVLVFDTARIHAEAAVDYALG